MTVVIKNMEREGYIYREEDPKDKRSFLISLTSKGREKDRRGIAGARCPYQRSFSNSH